MPNQERNPLINPLISINSMKKLLGFEAKALGEMWVIYKTKAAAVGALAPSVQIRPPESAPSTYLIQCAYAYHDEGAAKAVYYDLYDGSNYKTQIHSANVNSGTKYYLGEGVTVAGTPWRATRTSYINVRTENLTAGKNLVVFAFVWIINDPDFVV